MMNDLYYKMIYGSYINMTFSQIFPSIDDFKKNWNDAPNGLKYETFEGNTKETLTEDQLETIYYLLASEYMNSPIASNSVDRFKMIMNQYLFAQGPKYFKKLQIQTDLRNLDIKELREGSRMIYNKAFNDASKENIGDIDYMADYVNEQNVSMSKRNKAEALYAQYSILRSDITSDFINVFRRLFLVVVSPTKPLYYATEEEDE